jgi:hypothetical protein
MGKLQNGMPLSHGALSRDVICALFTRPSFPQLGSTAFTSALIGRICLHGFHVEQLC